MEYLNSHHAAKILLGLPSYPTSTKSIARYSRDAYMEFSVSMLTAGWHKASQTPELYVGALFVSGCVFFYIKRQIVKRWSRRWRRPKQPDSPITVLPPEILGIIDLHIADGADHFSLRASCSGFYFCLPFIPEKLRFERDPRSPHWHSRGRFLKRLRRDAVDSGNMLKRASLVCCWGCGRLRFSRLFGIGDRLFCNHCARTLACRCQNCQREDVKPRYDPKLFVAPLYSPKSIKLKVPRVQTPREIAIAAMKARQKKHDTVMARAMQAARKAARRAHTVFTTAEYFAKRSAVTTARAAGEGMKRINAGLAAAAIANSRREINLANSISMFNNNRISVRTSSIGVQGNSLRSPLSSTEASAQADPPKRPKKKKKRRTHGRKSSSKRK